MIEFALAAVGGLAIVGAVYVAAAACLGRPCFRIVAAPEDPPS